MSLSYFTAILLLVAAIPSIEAATTTLTIQPLNKRPGESCIAFGAGQGGIGPGAAGFPGTSPYSGFIYQNVPAFDLRPGDILAFDLGALNDFDVEIDIAMAPTTGNGDLENAGPFTTIVTNSQTPLNPRGDTPPVGDFKMQFTVEVPFVFGGGGLIIRFSNASDAYREDLTCTQVGVVGNATDPSGLLVTAFFADDDGVWPWDSKLDTIIGGFRLQFLNRFVVELAGEMRDQSGLLTVAAAVGDAVTYRIAADNNETDDATNIEIIATLADGLEFLQAESSPAAAAVYDAGPPATVSWTIGNLPAGESATLDIDLRVQFAAMGKVLTQSAVVTTVEPDPPFETAAPQQTDLVVIDLPGNLLDAGNDGNCFIATAAYGSSLAPEVAVLRAFRDRFLLTNTLGRAFVAWYYKNSPRLARIIRDDEGLRWSARAMLTPIVYGIKYPLATGFTILVLSICVIRRRRRLTVC